MSRTCISPNTGGAHSTATTPSATASYPKRDRKLLLTRKELRKLSRAVKEKGLTIVTRRLFISESGYAKLDIALARGKKEYDKRQAIKEKDLRRYSPE